MSSAPAVIDVTPRGHRAELTDSHGMAVGQSVATALEALNANKLRSLLTMLGIIIGVGAVIIMISIGRGASASVSARLQGLGTNVLSISPGSTNFGGVRAGGGSQPTLTEADALAINDQVPGLQGVSPTVGGSVQAVNGNQNWSTRASSVYPVYLTIQNWQIDAGASFADDDQQSARNVAVIGQTVLLNLFGDGNPGSVASAAAVGQTVRLNNVPFQIVGVLASKGGDPQTDDVVLVPFSAGQRRLFHRTSVNNITVQAANAEDLPNVQTAITDLLRERHRLTGPQNDFRVLNFNSIIDTAQGITQTLTLLLAGVAGVSLLVGGIGIMNIMLVSVTERTREIGIRMAIGARPSDVLAQFLIEAVSLSVVGGIIGIIIGIGGSLVMSRVAGWNTVIAPEAIILSFGFAGAVGVFFGFYPARKASRLDPIEALRYE